MNFGGHNVNQPEVAAADSIRRPQKPALDPKRSESDDPLQRYGDRFEISMMADGSHLGFGGQ